MKLFQLIQTYSSGKKSPGEIFEYRLMHLPCQHPHMKPKWEPHSHTNPTLVRPKTCGNAGGWGVSFLWSWSCAVRISHKEALYKWVRHTWMKLLLEERPVIDVQTICICPSVSLFLCDSVAVHLCPSLALSRCVTVPLHLCPSTFLSLCVSFPPFQIHERLFQGLSNSF